MIISLAKESGADESRTLTEYLESQGCVVTPVQTSEAAYLVAVGAMNFDIRRVGHMKGVKDVHRVSDAYKLVSRKWKVQGTALNFQGGGFIGEQDLALIAGPCSVETEETMRDVARFCKEQGVHLVRGGAFKPRTSPYSFPGLGIEGLKMFHRVAREFDLSTVSEVVSAAHIEQMYPHIDMFQVGTRNAQNFDLLRELGKVDKPVLLKRGMSSTLDELLQAAEYIFSNGNEKLVLCERGVRTFEKTYRNTLDINAIPVLKEKTHLPVVVDPSHGIGVRRWVTSVALAGVIAGADGIIFEAHPQPGKAYSDGQQTLNYKESVDLVTRSREVYALRKSWA